MRISLYSSNWGLPELIASELISTSDVHCLKAGETLFDAGDAGDGCHRLSEGVLKVTLASPRGNERILSILNAGAIVGDLAMIDGLPRSASVVALTDCVLQFISRENFERCADRHPQIYRYLTTILAQRLRDTDETISALAFLTAKGRVAHALLEIADSFGETADGALLIPNLFSQKDIAAMAGVARENTNRILREWERRRVVTKSARAYCIRDRAKLEREIDWE
jgi:CRP/FNR family transcriptional regulator, cyclic AMP receptor protein